SLYSAAGGRKSISPMEPASPQSQSLTCDRACSLRQCGSEPPERSSTTFRAWSCRAIPAPRPLYNNNLRRFGYTMASLDAWIARQNATSIVALERAISATHLCRRRERFGQAVTPAVGSVLASPVFADWDPRPDYFFHWVRDAALVMRTVAELMEEAPSATEQARWRKHFEDFVRFSLKLAEPDERYLLALSRATGACATNDQKFLRKEAEIHALGSDALLAEPRFNPDGTLDIFHWSRPQYDGPALRA